MAEYETAPHAQVGSNSDGYKTACGRTVKRALTTTRPEFVRCPDCQPEPVPASTVDPCPECEQGKCRNCDGTSWDHARDEPAVCPCFSAGHKA